MKKILSIILSVLILSSCLCLPAFATEELDYNYRYDDTVNDGAYMYLNISNSPAVWEFDFRFDNPEARVSSMFGNELSFNSQDGLFGIGSHVEDVRLVQGQWYHVKLDGYGGSYTYVTIDGQPLQRFSKAVKGTWCAIMSYVSIDNLSVTTLGRTYTEDFNDQSFDLAEEANGFFEVKHDTSTGPKPTILFDAVQDGDTVTLTVSLRDNPGFFCIAGTMHQKEGALTYQSASNGVIFPDDKVTFGEKGFYASNGIEDEDMLYGNGVLVTYIYKVNDVEDFDFENDIYYGAHCVPGPYYCDCYNTDDEIVFFTVESTYTVAEEPHPADGQIFFKAVQEDNYVTCTVRIEDNPGIYTAEGYIEYNTATAAYLRSENGDMFAPECMTIHHGSAFYFENSGNCDTTANGLLITQVFRVTDPANFDLQRDIIYHPYSPLSGYLGMMNYAGEEVPFSVSERYVHPTPTLPVFITLDAVQDGSTLTCTVSITDNPGLYLAYGKFFFADNAPVGLESYEIGELFADKNAEDFIFDREQFFLYNTDAYGEDIYGDGVIYTAVYNIGGREVFDLESALKFGAQYSSHPEQDYIFANVAGEDLNVVYETNYTVINPYIPEIRCPAEGYFGDGNRFHYNWSYSGGKERLEISGQGRMTQQEFYTLPSGITSQSSNIAVIDIMQGVIIPPYVFENRPAVTQILYSGTSVPYAAFDYDVNLTHAYIFNAEYIGPIAFAGCTSLRTVIMERAEEIDDAAFTGCTSLTEIYLSSTLITVGSGAFRNCTSLETVFFFGTREEWAAITVEEDNDALLNANVIFMYEQPVQNPDAPAVNVTAVKDANTVTYTMSLENNPGIYSFYGNVQVSDALTLTDTAAGSIFSDEDLTANGTRFLFTADGLENAEGDGDLITFTFEITDPASFVPQTAFTYSFEEGNDACAYNAQTNDIDDVNFTVGEYHFYVDAEIHEGNCTEEGYTVFRCVFCDDSYTDNYTPASGGHDFSAGYSIDRAPTYSVPGEKSRHCTRCGERCDITSVRMFDLNGDGKVNSKDLLRLYSYLTGVIELDEADTVIADMNCDGMVSSRDIKYLKMELVGLIFHLIEPPHHIPLPQIIPDDPESGSDDPEPGSDKPDFEGEFEKVVPTPEKDTGIQAEFPTEVTDIPDFPGFNPPADSNGLELVTSGSGSGSGSAKETKR